MFQYRLRHSMQLKDFDYVLPKDLIAQEPSRQRDTSRLMVLNRQHETIEHTFFNQLPCFLQKGDLLVANDTRVIPARLYGRKEPGGWAELFLLNCVDGGPGEIQLWECLVKSRRRIAEFSKIYISPNLTAMMLERTGAETWRVRLCFTGNFDEVLHEAGQTPLPPYIKRERNALQNHLDKDRYQTVYAKNNGAVAAPTAGFHFTHPLMEEIIKKGAEFVFVTLHIGYGTFQPIREEQIEKHKLHKEFFQITGDSADRIRQATAEKRRIIAVGTTATRVLETITANDGSLKHGQGFTDLYIYPGYTFKSVNAMITNFHLPMSSLLLLVSAFAKKDFILRAYQEAVEKNYRFFSYGDAMLIL